MLITPNDGVSASDEQLVSGAQCDPEAFAALYERFFDPVYWYCARRTPDSWEAEDAAAQTFSQAFTSLGRFDSSKGSFRSWLFRIAHNVTVDGVRRRHPDSPLDSAQKVVDPRPSPEEALLSDEAEHMLRSALSALTPDQRAVVELRLAGLNGMEIGHALGRSRSWVDTSYFRAIVRLRTVLGTETGQEGAIDGARQRI